MRPEAFGRLSGLSGIAAG